MLDAVIKNFKKGFASHLINWKQWETTEKYFWKKDNW